MLTKGIQPNWSLATALGILGLVGITTSTYAATLLSACGPLTKPSYAVTKDLNATGNCFVIQASGIAIDLGGHTITGNGTGGGITDNGTGFQQIIIVNGTIKNFINGIDLSQTEFVSIDSINSSHNKGAGVLIGGCCNTVTNLTANKNRDVGVRIDNCCNTIANVSAAGNHDGGIVIESGGETLASQVTGNNNGGNGLELDGGDSFLISGIATGNTGAGFSTDNGSNYIGASLLSNNTLDGADVGSDDGVNHSSIKRNGDNGVGQTGFAESGEDILINASSLNHNGQDGISLNIAGFNLVTGTRASHNGRNGIHLANSTETAGQNAIVGSVANDNKDNGVITDCPTNVYKLTALNNGGANLNEPSPAGCVNVNNNAP